MPGRKSTATMELAIGATIVLGVVILVVMLMAWGNSTSFLGQRYRLVVHMKNVGGLKEGAPVKMGGFQIGRVATIRFRPDSTEMELVLDIDEQRSLPKGSTAKVSTAGLVGDAFMEIVPGTGTEMLAKRTNVAEAERIESSPLPDMSEMMAKMSAFGDQLTVLTASINDIMSDDAFRKSIKAMAANIDNVSFQANQILQRGQGVIDNIEVASKNVSDLSVTLKENVGGIAGSAKSAIDNLNAGITDIRSAVNGTLGNPDVAKNLTGAIANINSVTALLAKRNDATDELITNLSAVSADLKAVTGHVRSITGDVDPATVARMLNSLSAAIDSMTGMVEKVKSEPVLALSINKAADRIVKMKFDEMAKARNSTSDGVLDEVTRWVRENMDRGAFDDPAYGRGARPYALPEVEESGTAEEKRPYIED